MFGRELAIGFVNERMKSKRDSLKGDSMILTKLYSEHWVLSRDRSYASLAVAQSLKIWASGWDSFRKILICYIRSHMWVQSTMYIVYYKVDCICQTNMRRESLPPRTFRSSSNRSDHAEFALFMFWKLFFLKRVTNNNFKEWLVWIVWLGLQSQKF